MRTRGGLFIVLAIFFHVLAPAVRAQVEAPDLKLLEQEQKIKSDSELKIQRDILDPILGRGKAMVFVDVELELLTQKRRKVETQSGAAETYRAADASGGLGAVETRYLLPGVPHRNKIGKTELRERPEAAQAREAKQRRGTTEERLSIKTIVKSLRITVIHDASIPEKRIELVRERIIDAMAKYKLKADGILFKPTEFRTLPPWQQFRQPGVFIPLTFALLLGLLLMFLFGPVTLYMGRYLRMLQQNQGPEVMVDSRFENAPGQQGGLGGAPPPGGAFEASFETLNKRLEEEEEEMRKKFEPFLYINEENLKRLAYLVRREEPWVIAVVLTYLKPEFARDVLSGLPRELQSRVALEMATIRQVTREQVLAIDNEIKHKVDFVLGGVEHLCNMLEDADEDSRQNILEYLQNERPALFDKVRQSIIMFADISGFSDREMQVIVRELKTENMARAMQGASPELMNKFLANMSTGAASLLKEAMEYEKDLNDVQIQDERKKIMDTIKALEREGRIVIRETGTRRALEGLEEEVSAAHERKSKWTKPEDQPQQQPGVAYPMGMGYPMAGMPMTGVPMTGMPMGVPPAGPPAVPPAPSPAPMQATPVPEEKKPEPPPPKKAPVKEEESEAAQYLDAGVRLYKEGKYDEALAYLDYAQEQDPNMWQAMQYRGLCLYGQDKIAEALELFDRLVERFPSDELKEWVENFKSTV